MYLEFDGTGRCYFVRSHLIEFAIILFSTYAIYRNSSRFRFFSINHDFWTLVAHSTKSVDHYCSELSLRRFLRISSTTSSSVFSHFVPVNFSTKKNFQLTNHSNFSKEYLFSTKDFLFHNYASIFNFIMFLNYFLVQTLVSQ